jgi:hypothetical protein
VVGVKGDEWTVDEEEVLAVPCFPCYKSQAEDVVEADAYWSVVEETVSFDGAVASHGDQ